MIQRESQCIVVRSDLHQRVQCRWCWWKSTPGLSRIFPVNDTKLCKCNFSLGRKSEKEFEWSSKAIHKMVAVHCFSQIRSRNAFDSSSSLWNSAQRAPQFIHQSAILPRVVKGIAKKLFSSSKVENLVYTTERNSHLIVVCIGGQLCQPCTMAAYQLCKSTLPKLHWTAQRTADLPHRIFRSARTS